MELVGESLKTFSVNTEWVQTVSLGSTNHFKVLRTWAQKGGEKEREREREKDLSKDEQLMSSWFK